MIRNANVEQKSMCIMVKEIGNGNPKKDKMYLLNRITPEDKPIQVATYPYAMSASFINAAPTIGAAIVSFSSSSSLSSFFFFFFFFFVFFFSIFVVWNELI
jgi:hypothetical protein